MTYPVHAVKQQVLKRVLVVRKTHISFQIRLLQQLEQIVLELVSAITATTWILPQETVRVAQPFVHHAVDQERPHVTLTIARGQLMYVQMALMDVHVQLT